ncbi:hypothetical protein HYC85_029346 [Camellia sinensis]|uniref:Uncharacterized protein n=1 Tax=Camellia sinensis TaxID=4442 RepID=A0A7J7FXV4_CAMSI|nr:hypothetical protein HYC85_029346 [Camellia sinensis]
MGKAGGVGCGSLETMSRSSTMKRCRFAFSIQSDLLSLSLRSANMVLSYLLCLSALRR